MIQGKDTWGEEHKPAPSERTEKQGYKCNSEAGMTAKPSET